MEPVNFSLAELNLPSLIPMIITVIGATFILLIDLVKKLDSGFFVTITMVTLGLNLGFLLNYSYDANGFFDMLLVDGLSILAQLVVVFGSMVFIPLALTSHRFKEFELGEYYAIFLYMIAGFQFMVSSDNLILIFVGLETSSLALYTLIALHKRDKSLEASVKYFVLGALAAALFAFGSMIFYGITGSIEINVMKEVILASDGANLGLLLLGSAFIIAALGFKLSLVPFHTWVPDVYEGSPAPLAGYISIIPKIAGFVIAIRLFEFLAGSPDGVVYTILWIGAVFTMTFGNILALVQDGVKRMLAYSSIGHAGFVMTAIVMGTTEANASLFLYWFLFLFTNLGAFTMLWMTRDPDVVWDDRYDHPYTKFAGMVYTSPVGAILMGIFMLSLAGIPPFALYWGKVFLITEAINSGHLVLGFIMAINSAISVYYYLKLIIYMFMKPHDDSLQELHPEKGSYPIKIVLGVSGVSVILLFLMIDPLMSYITTMLSSAGY